MKKLFYPLSTVVLFFSFVAVPLAGMPDDTLNAVRKASPETRAYLVAFASAIPSMFAVVVDYSLYSSCGQKTTSEANAADLLSLTDNGNKSFGNLISLYHPLVKNGELQLLSPAANDKYYTTIISLCNKKLTRKQLWTDIESKAMAEKDAYKVLGDYYIAHESCAKSIPGGYDLKRLTTLINTQEYADLFKMYWASGNERDKYYDRLKHIEELCSDRRVE